MIDFRKKYWRQPMKVRTFVRSFVFTCLFTHGTQFITFALSTPAGTRPSPSYIGSPSIIITNRKKIIMNMPIPASQELTMENRPAAIEVFLAALDMQDVMERSTICAQSRFMFTASVTMYQHGIIRLDQFVLIALHVFEGYPDLLDEFSLRFLAGGPVPDENGHVAIF